MVTLTIKIRAVMTDTIKEKKNGNGNNKATQVTIKTQTIKNEETLILKKK